MATLVPFILLPIFLIASGAPALGLPFGPASPVAQNQKEQEPKNADEPDPNKTAEKAPDAKETADEPSEEEEGAAEDGSDVDTEGDEATGPKRQPGLLPLMPLVEVDLGALPVGPGLVFEDSLIVVTEVGVAMRLDGQTGELLWKLGLPGSGLLEPSMFSESLLIVDRSGTLFFLDPATGTITKELPTGVSPILPPRSNEETIFLATADAAIIGYEVEKEQEVWRAAVDDTPLALAVGGELLVVSDATGVLHALDLKTGLERWQFRSRGRFPAPAVFDSKNERLFIGDTAGVFYSLSAENGKIHFRWPTGAAIPLPALVEEDRVFVATYANTLYCYRPWNGHELWRTNLPGRPAASPERARRRVVVVTFDGQVVEYGSGGTSDTPLYTAPADILPAPTLMPNGIALPLRSGRLLLLQTQAPPPKVDPATEGLLDGAEGEPVIEPEEEEESETDSEPPPEKDEKPAETPPSTVPSTPK